MILRNLFFWNLLFYRIFEDIIRITNRISILNIYSILFNINLFIFLLLIFFSIIVFVYMFLDFWKHIFIDIYDFRC